MKNIVKFTKDHRGLLTAMIITIAVATPGAFCFADSSTPTLNLDFTGALGTIFSYASMIFVALIPVAAIGIGFRFGGSLLSWVGDMLGDALHMRR